jgi:N-hydroxyarylamine O-acetyltransferase
MSVDLEKYFARIEYSGPQTRSVETLAALTLAHVSHIPFENLDVLLGRGICLDDEAVDAKLISAQRGGYCFEQNTLMMRVLLALGFSVRPYSARVRLSVPSREAIPPRTHVFLGVDVEGEAYLVDVGVGALSLTAPLKLRSRETQVTPHDARRIIHEDGRSFHQAQFEGQWRDVCEFTLEEMPAIDRELANWFTSAHPQSHFRNRLVVARALPEGGRVSILNREFTLRPQALPPEKHLIETPAELLKLLAVHFGLSFPASTRFQCGDWAWGQESD